jgi:hypothetical protein
MCISRLDSTTSHLTLDLFELSSQWMEDLVSLMLLFTVDSSAHSKLH